MTLTDAQMEYDRFAARRRALPTPVEKHFDEAVREVKLLDKQRSVDTGSGPKKSGTKRPPKKKR